MFSIFQVISIFISFLVAVLEKHPCFETSRCIKAEYEIPVDVFRNDSSVSYLHISFNVCFRSGMMPSDWGKEIIHPIPKSSTADRRDPLSYRGITLANSVYKIYCHVLNERLTKWVEQIM